MLISEGSRNYGKLKIKGKIVCAGATANRVALEKLKNRQSGKLATKKEGQNPLRINSKMHIRTNSDEERRFQDYL